MLDRDSATMQSVKGALESLVKLVGTCIQNADEVHVVTSALRSVTSLLWPSNSLEISDSYRAQISSAQIEDQRQLAAVCVESATAALPNASAHETLSDLFYEGPFFNIFAQLLLREVAVNWLASFALGEQKLLFDEFFTRAPPIEALSTLIPALTPVHEFNYANTGDPVEDLYSKNDYSNGKGCTAVCRQAERLLLKLLLTNEGIKKIALSFSYFPVHSSHSRDVERGVSAQGNKSILVAQLLSSIPDRANVDALSTLRSPLFFQSLTEQLLTAAQEKWNMNITADDKNRSDDPTILFIADVFSKLSRRGQAGIISTKMFPLLERQIQCYDMKASGSTVDELTSRAQNSVWPCLVGQLKDSYAMERITEALVRRMVMNPTLTDLEAYWILKLLYGDLLQVQISVRALFTEKFLLWKVLPVRCLRWILAFAVLCSPSNTTFSSVSAIDKDAVKRLIGTWAEKEFVQSVTIQQQAYVTAAVGLCLSALNGEDLHRLGFIQSLLQGIGYRLSSPLLPVRQMGKRIALAFSLSVDASKPLLLDDEDTVDDLRNWEGLEEFFSGQDNIMVSQGGGVPDLTVRSKTPESRQETQVIVGNDAESESSGKKKGRNDRELELSNEEDDPDIIVRLDQGFPFYEDDSGSSSGSESDNEFVPYDIPEEEDDKCDVKAPTKVYDVLSYLRKGDNPDMVEKALQVVERLVTDRPEELDHHASDLGHALLHVKSSTVGAHEEAVAERQQRSALIALVACSPLNALTTLRTEFLSPHVDVSQRLLILEVMAAGAKAIATGRYYGKPHEGKKVNRISDVTIGSDNSGWRGPGSSAGPQGAGPWQIASYSLAADNFSKWATSYERTVPLPKGTIKVGTSRRWGHQQAEQTIEQDHMQSKANAFAPLAALFMLPIMREYDVKKHGLDLLGRDFLVLGALLSMLADCMNCIYRHPQAAFLGEALLNLVGSREISAHSEPFVRKAALHAVSSVLKSLNPSDVIASLNSELGNLGSSLEWVREWALEVASNDTDNDCTLAAMACLHLHSELAMQAVRSVRQFDLTA